MITDYTKRHHAFAGCFNFRDIGGYPTRDGQQVAWGRYLRAGRQDRMTDADLERVRALGIRCQVDLRKPEEAAAQGRGPLVDMGAHYVQLPVIPDGGSDVLAQLVGDTAISGQRYLGYLEFGPDTWLRLFELLASAEHQPVIVHCTAGKDRTGVATAFLLAVLGVERAWIEADYALTNTDVPRQVDFLERIGALPDGIDRATMMHHAGVPDGAMRDFLDGLEARWGGPVAYLRSIGVSEARMQAVRAQFLVSHD